MDNPLRLSWLRLFSQAVLAAYGYALMEWLFFATKPSFMDAIPVGKKVELFFLTGLALTALVLPGLVLLRILGFIPGPTKRWQVFPALGALFPALLAAALTLLLVDNFTYTVFKFGVVTSTGIGRGVYAGAAILLLMLWYRQTLRMIRSPRPAAAGAHKPTTPSQAFRPQVWPALLAVGLISVSLVIAVMRISIAAESVETIRASTRRQPHIILLGGDGMDAANMSLYGYERDTTPRLEQLAETGLLAENNFTNASHTTGSVFSILTGKYPAQTRLMYSPNILQGADAYEHLPGILQRAGYTTVEITFPYYIDAYDVNLQEGFDEVNGRSIDQGEVFRLARQFHLEDAGYFLPRLSERIIDRLQHIFFLRDMPDPYRTVLQAADPNTLKKMSDSERINQLIRLLREADQPIFVHVHLMNTHGYRFYPRRQIFSAGQEQTSDWMPDFFDDAVLDFDSYVGQVVGELTRGGLMDQTVIVVYSDHADQWRTNDRIPLLFHFPRGEYAGRIATNTQTLDIAPTLLDYLGMETPAWMSGRSLLSGNPPPDRPIISAGVVGVECRPPDWWCVIDPTLVRPPFYQFGYYQTVVCQMMYTLTLRTGQWAQTTIWDHTAPCSPDTLPSSDKVRDLTLDHLRFYGFDISSLE